MSSEIIIEMKNISKRFGGIDALNNVKFSVRRGTVHALAGENGAGKSTLMKILTGVLHVDSGEIWLNGNHVEMHSYFESQNSGIAMVPQELDLVEHFTVAENIFLGCEPCHNKTDLIHSSRLYKDTQNLLDDLHMHLDPYAKIKDLSVSEQQMVVIARILSKNADVIILDEPTARLGHQEIKDLLDYLRFLCTQGKSIIYISHHLEEIFSIANEVSVLRDGRLVCSQRIEDISYAQLVHYMVDRDVAESIVYRNTNPIGNEILRTKSLSQKHLVKDASFTLYRGEILGFFGLVGSGRTETIRAMLGIDKLVNGLVFLDSQKVLFHDVLESTQAGIVLVPEDRRKQGLVLNMSITSNVTFGSLERFTRFGIINMRNEKAFVNKAIQKVNLSYSNLDQMSQDLSGGNQQKLVLTKQMTRENVKILIFDEPTRGVDIGSKDEIYKLIQQIAENGTSVIIISSEIPELQSICDRIVIMRKGRTVDSLDRKQFMNADTIMKLAIGG